MFNSLYQGGTYLAPAKVKPEMSPPTHFRLPPVTQEVQGHCPAGQGPLEDEGSFLIHDAVSQYYHIYAMLHAYQKFRNMCVIY
jgi:hypothetical protein